MSETNGKKPLLHAVKPDHRGSIAERLERLERSVNTVTASLPTWIGTGMLEVSKKLYAELSRDLYSQLAEEHARVFEVQADAVDLANRRLHDRLVVIEERLRRNAQSFLSAREALDEITEKLRAQAAQGEAS